MEKIKRYLTHIYENDKNNTIVEVYDNFTNGMVDLTMNYDKIFYEMVLMDNKFLNSLKEDKYFMNYLEEEMDL